MINVIIIGAGPSALFSAKTILENSNAISVEMLEQGVVQSSRSCPADSGKCQNCSSCATLEGIGGAGLFSDGKLVLDLTSGGKADGVSSLTTSEQHSLEEHIKETFVSFDGVSEAKLKPSEEVQDSIVSSFLEKNLEIKFYNVLHMGTKNLQNITTNFVSYLTQHFENRFKIKAETTALSINREKSIYSVVTNRGIIYADVVITAVGKSGAQWLKETLSPIGCTFIDHDFYFGVRMETQAEHIKDFVEYSFDPKIHRVTSGRKVKVHCVCKNGEIRYSRHRNALVVGGHSPYTKNNNSHNSSINANFNVLLSFNKQSFPVESLLSAFRTENENSVVVQKLSDFIKNQCSENFGSVVPSNPSMVHFGNIRSIMDLLDLKFSEIVIQFLQSIAELHPGIMRDDNLLYAPAIEWDMDTVKVNKHMETELENLFAIGDGAGISQGIVYSSSTGIIAAREIVARFEGENT